jgi:hypothetical protein
MLPLRINLPPATRQAEGITLEFVRQLSVGDY